MPAEAVDGRADEDAPMKAIVRSRYGPPDVLALAERPRPTPASEEVLVAVRAASVNPLDWHLLRGTPRFLRFQSGLVRPNAEVLGADVAGEVVDVGADVERFEPGDAVFGEGGDGGFAEYVAIEADRLASKPDALPFAEAAAVPIAGVTALQALRNHGAIEAGQDVLINGASGGVGTFAVQLATSFGASVTGVCSTRNLELVRSIGADHVVDYTETDFTRTGDRYDLLVDAVGNRSVRAYRRTLRADGRCVVVGFTGVGQMLQTVVLGGLWSRIGGRRIGTMLATTTADDLAALAELLADGAIEPVVDRRYSLEEVPEAVAYVEEGHARGKVVIELD